MEAIRVRRVDLAVLILHARRAAARRQPCGLTTEAEDPTKGPEREHEALSLRKSPRSSALPPTAPLPPAGAAAANAFLTTSADAAKPRGIAQHPKSPIFSCASLRCASA